MSAIPGLKKMMLRPVVAKALKAKLNVLSFLQASVSVSSSSPLCCCYPPFSSSLSLFIDHRLRSPLLLCSRKFSMDPSPPLWNESNVSQSRNKEQISPEGCGYEHWLVVMDRPMGYPLRDEIVQMYVETLASFLGSVDEAKKLIYSVSTKYYYAFGCRVSKELAYKIKCLPNVRWVLPDSYLHETDKDYGVVLNLVEMNGLPRGIQLWQEASY